MGNNKSAARRAAAADAGRIDFSSTDAMINRVTDTANNNRIPLSHAEMYNLLNTYDPRSVIRLGSIDKQLFDNVEKRTNLHITSYLLLGRRAIARSPLSPKGTRTKSARTKGELYPLRRRYPAEACNKRTIDALSLLVRLLTQLHRMANKSWRKTTRHFLALAAICCFTSTRRILRNRFPTGIHNVRLTAYDREILAFHSWFTMVLVREGIAPCGKHEKILRAHGENPWRLSPSQIISVERKPSTYLIISPFFRQNYIGKTVNPWKRASVEYHDAIKNRENRALSDGENSRRAQVMAQLGIENFAWIPLHRDVHERDLLEIEKYLIRRYHPSMNNDFFTKYHRRRNRVSLKLTRQKKRLKKKTATAADRGLTTFVQVRRGRRKPKFNSLQNFLKHRLANNRHTATVKWRSGSHTIDKIPLLKRLFGTSPCVFTTVIDGKKESISCLLKTHIGLIRTQETGIIHIQDIQTKGVPLTRRVPALARLAKHKSAAEKFIRTASFDIVINTRMAAHRLNADVKNHKFIYDRICQITDTALRRWKVRLPQAIAIRIPYHPSIRMNQLKLAIYSILDNTPLNPSIRHYLKRTTRIVFTKRPSIGDILCNHIKIAKEHTFKSDTTECHCDAIDPDHTLPRIDGHLAFKATETEHTKFHALHLCTTNIPQPKSFDLESEATRALCEFASDLRPLVNPKFSRRKFTNVKKTDPNKQRHFNKQSLHNDLRKLGIKKTAVKHVLRDINNFYTTPPTQEAHTTSIPSIRTIINLYKTYSNKLIFSPLDKNPGCLFISCPCIQRKAIEETFVDDTDHYIEVDTTFDEIKLKLDKLYKQLKDPRKKRWGYIESGSLPYSYILHKMKDVERRRPLVSYRKHPFRRIFNVASRMITFIANTLETKHCNLSRCTDLLDRITKIQRLAHAKHGKHARFVYKMGDIKNMYTELRHEVIIKALDWALNTFRRQTRRNMLSATKYGRKGVYVGHTTLDSEIKLSLAEIRKIVLFDLENAVFNVGSDTRLRQIIGIPMGSPISAALAPLVCIYFEHLYFSGLENAENESVHGIRYVDDQLALAFYNTSDPQSKLDAIHLVEELSECYDEKMTMENEACNYNDSNSVIHTSNFVFLEARVHFDGHTICSKHNNKNELSVREENKQKFFRYHHFDSFASRQQKIGAIIETLVRTSRYTSNFADLKESTRLCRRELSILGYPKPFFNRALKKLRRTRPEIWAKMKIDHTE